MSTSSPSSVQPGRAFGKYVIRRVLAEGGMATVFEAHHATLGTRVAVKLLNRSLIGQRDIVARFEREARAVARLESPHVARVIDVDTSDDGRPYIVMEYLDGRDLEDELLARSPLPVGDAVAYLLEAIAGVAAAHRANIIHRDLKPANIFIAQEGDRKTVKVLDFGISKIDSPQEVSATSTQTMLGTPLYMSPEQVRSARDVDGRTDIWSLGVVLYEMLTGQLPFLREEASGVIAAIVSDPIVPVGDLRPDLPPALAAAIMKALSKDRSQRFRLVEELGAALLPFAPPWFRPPAGMDRAGALGGGGGVGGGVPLPAYLTSSLAEGMDSERTVADPNAAPDALRPIAGGPYASAPYAPGPYAPTPMAPFVPRGEVSQPGAVARTTAGGQQRAGGSSLAKVVLAVAIGVSVGALVFAGFLILRSRGSAAAAGANDAHGKLEVRVASGAPACVVSVDGVTRGAAPLLDIDVTAGLHDVTCGASKPQKVIVGAGETQKVLLLAP